jgi:hypothetical protein
VEDVNDPEELTKKLAAIATDPEPAAIVGARGRAFAREAQQHIDFPLSLERILEAAAHRTLPVLANNQTTEPEPSESQFLLTQIAIAAIAKIDGNVLTDSNLASPAGINVATAQNVLADIKRRIAEGKTSLQSLAQAVEIETAIAVAETGELQPRHSPGFDPLFRLDMGRWALGQHDLPDLIPLKETRLRLLHFDYDVSRFRGAKTVADFPLAANVGPSHVVAFRRSVGRDPLLVDTLTALFLELCDGNRTVREILRELPRGRDTATSDDDLGWVENLFRWGLISLRRANSPKNARNDAITGPGRH